MDKFTKITVGFVAQAFEKNDKGKFVCTNQEFIAGDQCDYEDAKGNPIDPPDYEYQPYNMTLQTKQQRASNMIVMNKMHGVIEQVLHFLDVGGEQSRQFAKEIKMLNGALNSIKQVNDSCPKCGAGSDDREFTGKDFLGIEAIHIYYHCKKCNSNIIEEFTLTDVFIDDGR